VHHPHPRDLECDSVYAARPFNSPLRPQARKRSSFFRRWPLNVRQYGSVLFAQIDTYGISPRAMLSDFGTSQDALRSGHIRTGNTGTLEYSAPETLSPSTPTDMRSFGWTGGPATASLPPLDSKADMWSLGMILHKMVFFRLAFCVAPTEGPKTHVITRLPWMTGQPASDRPDAGLGPARVRHADSGGLQAELEDEIRRYRGYAPRTQIAVGAGLTFSC